ncbi:MULTISPECIES: cation diffusion facilitator family transporter [Serratia]|uniref:cation diffusion facilitator family transporter n=1 Tax=Serratia TaxID=613 RepID=UPI00148D3DDD|nr:cation transporter [Serratia marcescens]HAT4518868.1 cation transporter [Serratia marcescens]
MAQETRLLKQSALMMLMVAVVGITVGVMTGSEAILFDGMFSLIATLIKLLMVLTSRLIKKEYSRRFQFGFWHLEPMVLTTEGVFIGVIALYALLNGVQGLLQGGTAVEFGGAILYAFLFTLINFSYYFYVKKRNQRVQSSLVSFDNISWFVDALLALGLLVSFSIAFLLTKTQYAWLAPYVDPALLVVIALAMLPSVIKILRPALKDMLRVAPIELDALVEKTMAALVARHNIIDYHSYCQNDGRISIVEINILMGVVQGVKLEELDAIREEIQSGLGMDSEELWLTVSFTRDRKWLN